VAGLILSRVTLLRLWLIRFAMFFGNWQNKTSGKLSKPNTIIKIAGQRN